MMNVLMVEDDADQVALWREALAPHGVRLRHAATREALEAEVAVDAPDVMLFDYWLEPYTGPQLVRMLRDLPEGVQWEQVYVYDLMLPPGFVPRNQDGEVSEHRRVGLAALLDIMSSGAMTVDATLVTLDALRRRGWPGTEDRRA